MSALVQCPFSDEMQEDDFTHGSVPHSSWTEPRLKPELPDSEIRLWFLEQVYKTESYSQVQASFVAGVWYLLGPQTQDSNMLS